jgi:hypothetical protein
VALLVELAPASFAIAGERFHAVLIMHSPESRVLRLHHNIAIVLLTIRRQTNTRLPRIVTFWLRIEAGKLTGGAAARKMDCLGDGDAGSAE